MKLYEMEGFLRGRHLPGDLLVGESNAQYLTRKLNEGAEAKQGLHSAQLTISQIIDLLGERATLSISEQVAALNQHMVNLAVENAGMKELIRQHANGFAVCPKCAHEEPSETDDIVASYRSLEIPATDAAIANIQAQGVEAFATQYPSAGFAALSFAAQLRKEAGNEQ